DGIRDKLVTGVQTCALPISLVANGVTRSAGQALAAPTAVKTWISQRRDYLVQQLAAIAANFAITSNGGADFSVSTNSVTLTGTRSEERRVGKEQKGRERLCQ